MSLSLQLAHMLIMNKFHTLALSHLSVRIHDSSLFIYSMEQHDEAYRAALTLFPSNTFILSIANHRGEWQPTPYIGGASELVAVLTKKFAFALARWPE